MQTAVLTPVDVAAIKELNTPWVEACLARDWDALLELCTDDVVFLPPDEPMVAGAQLRPWLENYPEIRRFEAEFDHIEGQNDLAVARGHFTMTIAMPSAPAPLTITGKFLDLFRKDLRGKWHYATVAWNASVPSALRSGIPTIAAPLEATSLVPTLTVDDLPASIKLFEGLGLVVTDRWEEEGKLTGVMMGGGVGMINLTQDDWKKGRDRAKGIGFRTWIETGQDIDRLAERARTAGVTLHQAPYDTPWGTRAFEVITPEGFVVSIARSMPAT